MNERPNEIKPSQIAAARLKVAIADRKGEEIPDWIRQLARLDMKAAGRRLSKPTSPDQPDQAVRDEIRQRMLADINELRGRMQAGPEPASRAATQTEVSESNSVDTVAVDAMVNYLAQADPARVSAIAATILEIWGQLDEHSPRRSDAALRQDTASALQHEADKAKWRRGTARVRSLANSPEGYLVVEMDDDNVFIADPENLQSLHSAQQNQTPVRYWMNNFQRIYGQPRGGLGDISVVKRFS